MFRADHTAESSIAEHVGGPACSPRPMIRSRSHRMVSKRGRIIGLVLSKGVFVHAEEMPEHMNVE
jgi:hypothetical protein